MEAVTEIAWEPQPLVIGPKAMAAVRKHPRYRKEGDREFFGVHWVMEDRCAVPEKEEG